MAGLSASARSIDGFIRSSSRIGGASSEFTKLTASLRPATNALRGFSRAVTSATAAARGLHGAFNVASGANASTAAINAQTRALTGLARAQRQVVSGARAGGRHNGGGHEFNSFNPTFAAIGGARAAGHISKTFAERAGTLQDEIVRARLNGLDEAEISAMRTRSEQIAKDNRSTTIAGNMKAMIESRAAMGGHLPQAIQFAEKLANASTVMGFMSGDKNRANAFSESAYDMLRTGELRNIINDPKRMESFIQGGMAAYIATGGRVTAKDWHASAIFGRSSTMGLSDEFFNTRLPFLVQEMKSRQGVGGGQAAGAVMQTYQAIVRGVIASKNVDQWINQGLVDKKDVVTNKMGQKSIPPARVKGYDTFQKDPAKWFQEFYLPSLEKYGPMTPEMIQSKVAGHFGALKAQQLADILAIQGDRMKSFEEMLAKTKDVGPSLDLINQTYSQSVDNLKAKATDFAATIAAAPIEAATAGIRSLADAIQYLTGKAGDLNGGHNGSDVTNQSFGGKHPWLTMAGAAAGVGLLGWGATATTWGRRALGAAGGYAVGGPFGAAIGGTLGGGFGGGGLNGAAAQLIIAAQQLQAAAVALGASPITAAAAATAATTGATALGAANVATLGTTVASAALPVLAAGLGVGFIAAISTDKTRKALTEADSGPKLLPVTPKLNLGTGDGGAGKILQLPDFTSYGIQAGQQVGQGVATGVQNSGGPAVGEATSIMDRIRAIFSVGVDVPVRVQQPNVTPLSGGAGGLPAPVKPASGSPPPAKPVARGGDTYHVAVHVSGAGDPNAVARAVHDRFKTAARSQLSDGVYS